MPELPEVQTVVNGLNELVVGRTITGAKVLWPEYVTGFSSGTIDHVISGQQIRRSDRRGKFILVNLNDFVLMVHLRMTGKILIQNSCDQFPKHTHLILFLDDERCLAFNDVRKFGRLEIIERKNIDSKMAELKLGPEPFSEEFCSDYLLDKLKNRTRSIKNSLLDQSIVAGLGNIYICEALLNSRINPFRPAGGLSGVELETLIFEIRTILTDALALGGSSINDYLNVNGESGKMQNNFNVYGREGMECTICGSAISRKKDVGRSTFWCQNCQK